MKLKQNNAMLVHDASCKEIEIGKQARAELAKAKFVQCNPEIVGQP